LTYPIANNGGKSCETRTENNDLMMILLVEDDEGIRELSASALEEAGLSVAAARNGHEALRLLKIADRDIDLLFTDIRMPGGLNGFALARAARHLKPDLKILYTTGFAENLTPQEVGERYGPILRKPYRPGDLLKAIENLLSK
jgi:CheY-like chemotaxis protein